MTIVNPVYYKYLRVSVKTVSHFPAMSGLLSPHFLNGGTMPAHAIDLETKQQAQTWLLPPYSYSIRQIASELEVGVATVQE